MVARRCGSCGTRILYHSFVFSAFNDAERNRSLSAMSPLAYIQGTPFTVPHMKTDYREEDVSWILLIVAGHYENYV